MIKERHKNGYLKNRDVKLVNRYTELKSTKTVVIQSYNFGELISKRKNKDKKTLNRLPITNYNFHKNNSFNYL